MGSESTEQERPVRQYASEVQRHGRLANNSKLSMQPQTPSATRTPEVCPGYCKEANFRRHCIRPECAVCEECKELIKKRNQVCFPFTSERHNYTTDPEFFCGCESEG